MPTTLVSTTDETPIAFAAVSVVAGTVVALTVVAVKAEVRPPTTERTMLLVAGIKLAIVNGLVELNGAVERQKGKQVKAGDRVTFNGETLVVAVAPPPRP